MSLSYATLAEADTYLECVLNKDAWELTTDARRTTALAQATNNIRALNVPDFSDVTLYPTVPQNIIDATTEIALKLLEGYDPEFELEQSRVKSQTFDRIKQVNKEGEISLHIIAGVASSTAFRILLQYLPNPTTVRLDRLD